MTTPVFPTIASQEIGMKRKPIWRTGVQQNISGRETTLAYMSYPLYQWTLDFSALRSYAAFLEFDNMIGFINSLSGMASPFLFQDPEDNAVVAQPFGVGNASQINFQLVRTFGGYTEPVQQPAVGSLGAISIYANGTVLANGPTGWQLGANGVVAINPAPSSGTILTWTGGFFYLCRMLQDDPEFEQEAINIWNLKTLAFISKKQ